MKHYMRRCQAAILSAALAFTMFPAPMARASGISGEAEAALAASVAEAEVMEPQTSSAASAADTNLLADFDFNTDPTDGKFTSKDTVATVVGTGAALQDGNAGQGKALHLDGTASYLDLKKSDGTSLLTGATELTISYEFKPERTGTNWGYFIAPNDKKQGIGQEAGGELYLGALIKGGTTTLERYNQKSGGRPKSASAATGSGWTHVDAVYTPSDTTIYVDGIKVSAEASAYPLPDILGNESIFQIGKANWGNGEYTQGWMDNFKIYNKALTEAEIQSVPNEAYRNALMDQQAAKIAPVTIQAGQVKLPDYNGTVTWKSAMDAVSIAEDGLTATAVQPAVGAEALMGQLTAVVTVYGITREVPINVTVKPQVGENDPYGYLMVHFVEDSAGYAEKIYLDISRGDNPEQWDPLNGRQPILASNLGKTGCRDPFLTYNPETGTYYILATDLRVFGGDNAGWGVWQQNYSTKMNIWESKDLISWSEVRQFDVALNTAGEKQANMGMMWAPEATWVPDYYGENDGAFVVYWSSQCYTDEAQTQKDSGSKIMWGATKDFTQETWQFGGVFLDGGSKGWIDTTIAQNDGKTYHITKSNAEQIIMEVTSDKEWWKPTTNWKRIQSEIGKSRFGSVEGPAVFKDHSNDSRWYLFVDDLPTPGYQPMISTDLDKGWEYLDSSDYFLTSLTKHGGVISLTKGQYDAIRKADAVSLAENQTDSVSVTVGAAKEDIAKALPAAAKVNLAYGMGISELPIDWDLSQVKTDAVGKYQAVGTVRSISANKDQWVGKGNSTDWQAEDKTLYSSRALKLNVEVRVSSGQVEPGKADKSFLQAAIAKADALAADQGKYTEDSWANLQKALTQAKAVMAKEDAAQQEADDAEAAVEEAIKALKKAAGKDAIAYFDFEEEAQYGKFTSNDAEATVTGTVKLQERDAQNGKALYLDGSASWLSLAKSGGGSLLSGLDEVTISFDVKPDRTSTNWGFFAAPNANKQEYGKEYYIGAMINGGKTTIERYNNNGSRPNSASATTGTGWSHVDAVLTAGMTTLYVDGLKQAEEASSHTLPAILGSNSIFYIGKANWDNGEYTKGWIDNFAVYGKALSEEELVDPDKAEPLVEAAKDALTLDSQATADFALPKSIGSNVSISWSLKGSSDCLSVADGMAKVTRPARGQQDASATLVAELKLGSVKAVKEFTITIPALSEEDVKDCIVIPAKITSDLQSEVNGEKITWSCSVQGIVSADGKVTCPANSQKVTLTAKVGTDVTVSGEAEVLKYGGSILSYVTKETDLLAYEDSRRSDALYVAARNDSDGSYEPLNKGKAILYVKWSGDQKQNPNRQMGSPSFFRKADGTLGVVASSNNSTDSIYLWDTKDTVTFTNERSIRLNAAGIAVKDPVIFYDSVSKKYKVFWKGEGGASYLTTLENLTDAAASDSAVPCDYQKASLGSKAPDNADMEQASLFAMSEEEYKAFMRKYGRLYNTKVQPVNVQAKKGEDIAGKLPKTVTAEYNDGSAKNLGIVWDAAELGKVDVTKPGTYKVKGTVQQDAYAYPFIEERADPHIFYNEDDGYYYSTGSYYEANMTSCNVAQSYRKLDIRRAKTIEGLKTAEEYYIMESAVGDRWGGFFWAPEFHKINGKWYCLVGAHDFGTGGITANTNWNTSNWCSRSILIPYEGDGDSSTSMEADIQAGGMLDASQWGEPIILNLPSNANASFDVSYYQAEDGQGYYIIPRSANLLIVKVQKNGVQPEGDAVKLKGLEWPWEYGVQEGTVSAGNPEGNDQGIVEGPYLFEYGDKVYISYSGATVDKYYCLGLMMADKGSNLMDPASWTQIPYPVLSSYDTYEGKIGGKAYVGGGHNSVVLDEYGNLALVYHARPYPDPHAGQNGAGGLFDPCRHTVVKSVNVAYDGSLVFNMTAEEELAPENREIEATIVIEDGEEPPVKVTSVTLDKTSLSLTVGKSQRLTATIAPADAANKELKWKSKDSKIAEVDAEGKVTAKKAGTVTITVTSADGPAASCKVTVKAAVISVKSVKLNVKKAVLGVGEKLTLKATVSPSNATSKKVTWKSSKSSVVAVNSKGLIRAKKTGSSTITASAGGKKATCKITVKKAPKKIALTASKKSLKRKQTYQMKVKLPKNTASYKKTYSTSNKKVATVSASGKVKAIKKGKATITVKAFNGKKAKIVITVK